MTDDEKARREALEEAAELARQMPEYEEAVLQATEWAASEAWKSEEVAALLDLIRDPEIPFDEHLEALLRVQKLQLEELKKEGETYGRSE